MQSVCALLYCTAFYKISDLTTDIPQQQCLPVQREMTVIAGGIILISLPSTILNHLDLTDFWSSIKNPLNYTAEQRHVENAPTSGYLGQKNAASKLERL